MRHNHKSRIASSGPKFYTGWPVSTLAQMALLVEPDDGNTVWVVETSQMFVADTESVAVPNGSTIIPIIGGGNWTLLAPSDGAAVSSTMGVNFTAEGDGVIPSGTMVLTEAPDPVLVTLAPTVDLSVVPYQSWFGTWGPPTPIEQPELPTTTTTATPADSAALTALLATAPNNIRIELQAGVTYTAAGGFIMQGMQDVELVIPATTVLRGTDQYAPGLTVLPTNPGSSGGPSERRYCRRLYIHGDGEYSGGDLHYLQVWDYTTDLVVTDVRLLVDSDDLYAGNPPIQYGGRRNLFLRCRVWRPEPDTLTTGQPAMAGGIGLVAPSDTMIIGCSILSSSSSVRFYGPAIADGTTGERYAWPNTSTTRNAHRCLVFDTNMYSEVSDYAYRLEGNSTYSMALINSVCRGGSAYSYNGNHYPINHESLFIQGNVFWNANGTPPSFGTTVGAVDSNVRVLHFLNNDVYDDVNGQSGWEAVGLRQGLDWRFQDNTYQALGADPGWGACGDPTTPFT